jgi:CheY-like chemotaxis protein
MMSKTLLLADDSVVIQKLVGLSFASENIKIVATDNGDDAILKAREVVPDVVLADVVMPGKSGYEVCETIKQAPELAHIPVLLLTGTFEAFDEGRATRAHADGHITKPFEAQALVQRVLEIMNRPATEPKIIEETPTPGTDQAPEQGPPAPNDDFFDVNVTTLSPIDTPSILDVSATPGRAAGAGTASGSSDDTSTSILFGAPGEGEGAADDLDLMSGGLSIGQAVTPQTDSEVGDDRTVAIQSEGDEVAVSANDDALADFDDDLGLDDPLALSDPLSAPFPAGTDDLDSALEDASADAEPTLMVARDEANARTSPNLDSERRGPGAEPISGRASASSREDLTIHAPSAPIDGDAAEAFAPDEQTPRWEEATVVADLDARLEEPAENPRDTTKSPAARGREAAALDLCPSNLDSDDLDFGFDVSEQAPPDGDGDRFEDSFSSLMDISEQTLMNDAGLGDGEAAPPETREDESLVGYDVSSSDLATGPPPPADSRLLGVEVSDPVSASAAPAVPPPLPPQHRPDAAVGEDRVDGTEKIEATGDDVAAQASAEADRAVAEPPRVRDEPQPSDEPIAAHAQDIAVGVVGRPAEADETESKPTSPVASHESEAPGSESTPVPDLSPMMEQRIQETLEKVAWEAFSDLSESIVKQVIGRVEKIAWDVIPQMAETLVREEIRKMKGEDD